MKLKILTFLTLGLFSTTALASSICSDYKTPATFLKTKEAANEKIRVFANKKVIAQKADDTLSKLMSAKSPLILNWFKARDLGHRPEEELVREWRDYYARFFILTKYPQNDVAVDAETENLVNSINADFATDSFKTKMQSLFQKSKSASLLKIQSFKITEADKKQLVSRIEKINLYWLKDFKTSKFKQMPLDFLDWGIAYDPAANEINMGINALSYPNDETYLAVFAHEMGHSFDSCRWGAFFTGPWPFENVGQCLRGPDSVHALKRDDSQMPASITAGRLSSEMAQALKLQPTCNKLNYPPIGTQADQLPESFADWFSAETVATMQDLNFKNLRADLCETKKLIAGSSYPGNEQRLNRIYFVQPVLHEQLKMSVPATEKNTDKNTAKIKYCSFN